MEPIIVVSDISLNLAEILLGFLLFIFGGVLGFILAAMGKKHNQAINQQLQQQLSLMHQQQNALQGRLAQFAEHSAQRDAVLRDNLDKRLDIVSQHVGSSLQNNQEHNHTNLKQLHERLAIIDHAQKNIETLAGEVSALQNLLSNKQSRGAFGEKQMQDLIETYLPPSAYSFQKKLTNGKRVDALIHLPAGHGDVAIDSKFPLEAWRRLTEADNTAEAERAQKQFATDVLRHIKDIAQKYLILGETHEIAMLFLPSEAIYAELHSHFPKVIDQAFTDKVVIVSPTSFMATLHTMRAVMRDANMREQAHIIQGEIGKIAKDINRLDDRVGKLQRHYNQASEDMREIRISTEKITKRADKIESLDVSEKAQTPHIAPPSDTI